MRMHVKTKGIATAGLLVAFTVVMLILSSIIETSSLFFIAAASFCVGIAIREWKTGFGFAFWVASVLLNLLLAPNKLYCVTYAAMGLYILLSEILWEKIASTLVMNGRRIKLWIGKYVIFNVMYIPAIFFLPKLIMVDSMPTELIIIFIAAGQVVLLVYDVAYRYFQARIWGKLRAKLVG